MKSNMNRFHSYIHPYKHAYTEKMLRHHLLWMKYWSTNILNRVIELGMLKNNDVGHEKMFNKIFMACKVLFQTMWQIARMGNLRNAYRILVRMLNTVNEFGETDASIYDSGYKRGPGDVD
jgi:hypothetical protein